MLQISIFSSFPINTASIITMNKRVETGSMHFFIFNASFFRIFYLFVFLCYVDNCGKYHNSMVDMFYKNVFMSIILIKTWMIKKIGHFHRILQLKLVDYNGFGHWCKCFVTLGLLIAGAGKKSTELLGLRQKHFSTRPPYHFVYGFCMVAYSFQNGFKEIPSSPLPSASPAPPTE